MGQKKHPRMNECIACTLSINRLGAVPLSIHSNINTTGTWRFKNCFFWTTKKLITPLRTAVVVHTARIIGSTEWWHQTRMTFPAAASYRITENTDGISAGRRDVCQPMVVGTTTTTICNEYTTSTISLQQQSFNLKCPTTLTTIIHQVSRN